MKGTATLIGSTGMIGSYLLDCLKQDRRYAEIRLLVRRPIEKTDPDVSVRLVNFSDPESVKLALEGSEVVFLAIGTTRKKVKGDKDLYRRIDFDIPVQVARFSKEVGCQKFIFVSSVNANSKSRTFYLRLKGEVEDAISAIGIRSVHAMQPSVLLGYRNEKRRGEKFLQTMMFFFSTFMLGGLKKFKAIHGGTVAKAMVNAAEKDEPGFFRHTYKEIVQLASGK